MTEVRKAMENPDLFEGDIVLPNGRNALPTDTRRWANGVIPYVVDPSANDAKHTIEQAIQHYNQHTCIRFKHRTNEKDYVRFFKGNGCFSMVGRMGNGKQDISLGNGCNYLSTAVHEMMHAIGFWHEHSRSDRDNYIQVHYENIKQDLHAQFVKLKPNENRLFVPFDFTSVMLYGPTAFSFNGKVTVSSKIAGKQVKNHPLNQGLSASDIDAIKKLYHCK